MLNKMNLNPTALEGELVPFNPPTVAVKLMDSDKRHGGHAIALPRFAEPEKKQALDVGEKRHHELLDAIKTLKVDQSAEQNVNIEEALAENRAWRN